MKETRWSTLRSQTDASIFPLIPNYSRLFPAIPTYSRLILHPQTPNALKMNTLRKKAFLLKKILKQQC